MFFAAARLLRRIPLPAAGLLIGITLQAAAPTVPVLSSPDGRIAVQLRLADRLSYDVSVDERPVLVKSTLSLQVDDATFGVSPRISRITPGSHDGIVEPPVRQKAARFRDHYNELRVDFDGGYAVVFRAYDEGVAYRWETALARPEVKVRSEEVGLNFAGNLIAYYPEEQGFFSHNERMFLPRALADLAPHNLGSIPVVVDAGHVKVALTDADVEDYPGLWFRGTNGNGLAGTFPPFPLQEELKGDRDFRVVQSADYLAVTKGTRAYPWRVLGVAHRDADLITNPLVYLLASPSRVADTSWIKPGKVAWDWWNANNLYGVDFKSGINTATYKYFIDFAAANGIEYIILDEGWYKLGDLLTVAPGMDIPELVAYGRARKVGIILWVVWKTLDDQFQAAFDQFAKWGVSGIKVDFMQRDDQPVMNYYHRVCREAAKRHLLVDFHGAVRPAMLTRTWPNLISTEGVRGAEWNKWSNHITPEHNTTLPFTRMFVGPMDYTPGAMLNANRTGFAPNFDRPSSQGTRGHQLALYVVFESPLQMLCDSPSRYQHEPEAMAFLRAVPTQWDETRVLDARIADYVVIARRRGADWYLGAITDWNARDVEIDLAFLPAGTFQLEEWSDGVNADRYAQDFRHTTRSVTSTTKLKVHLAEGGGFAARLHAR